MAAIAAAVAGFHETPNLLQLVSALIAGLLTALVAFRSDRTILKKPKTSVHV